VNIDVCKRNYAIPFPFAGLKVRHKNHPYEYNHTLATILVEYASAVSFTSMGIIHVQTFRCLHNC